MHHGTLSSTLRPRKSSYHFADDIFKCIFWMKVHEFRLRFYWILFLRSKFLFQQWFRLWLGSDQATSHYLNQWLLVYWRIYVSISLRVLIGIASALIGISDACVRFRAHKVWFLPPIAIYCIKFVKLHMRYVLEYAGKRFSVSNFNALSLQRLQWCCAVLRGSFSVDVNVCTSPLWKETIPSQRPVFGISKGQKYATIHYSVYKKIQKYAYCAKIRCSV